EPIVAADLDELARRAAAWMAEEVRQAVARRRRCALALSGGSTPRPAYERLATEPAVPWNEVEIYFGDERAVPPTDPASNYRVAVITAGAWKEPVVAKVLGGPWRPDELPAQLAREGTWLIDRAAAADLTPR